jgi:hypothetical protein
MEAGTEGLGRVVGSVRGPLWEEHEVPCPVRGICREGAGAVLWLLGGDLLHVKGEVDSIGGGSSEGGGVKEARFAEAEATDKRQDHNCEGTEVLRGGALLGESGEALQGEPGAGLGYVEV